MRITIINVDIEKGTTKTGKPFDKALVAYKNPATGKVESKTITQYSKVFKEVANSTVGQAYDITQVKDDAGYWQWETFVVASGAEPAQPSTSVASKAPGGAGNTAPRSNYETPEERANRQVLIVRQSCLSNAITTLNAGKGVKPDEAVALAQTYVDWVFGTESKGAEAITEMDDDIPY